jgi:hypothetical protein
LTRISAPLQPQPLLHITVSSRLFGVADSLPSAIPGAPSYDTLNDTFWFLGPLLSATPPGVLGFLATDKSPMARGGGWDFAALAAPFRHAPGVPKLPRTSSACRHALCSPLIRLTNEGCLARSVIYNGTRVVTTALCNHRLMALPESLGGAALPAFRPSLRNDGSSLP